jgi:hypothetical protein
MSANNQTIENSHGFCTNAVVREAVCKTILNRSGLSDYSLSVTPPNWSPEKKIPKPGDINYPRH